MLSIHLVLSKVATGPLTGWEGEVHVGQLILGSCCVSGWVLWPFCLAALPLDVKQDALLWSQLPWRKPVFQPSLQSCFIKCLQCHIFWSEWKFFAKLLLETTSYFTPWLVLGSYWWHYCHFLSLSFLNLPNPELQSFVESIFCLPALRAMCQIMCKRSNPLPPALDTGWGNEEEWSYWFHFGGQGGSSRGRIGV